MSVKEQIKARVEQLDEAEELQVVAVLDQLESARQTQEKSLFDQLLEIQIDAPPDFSVNLERYASGELPWPKAEGDADDQVLTQKYGELADPDWQRVFALLDEVGPQIQSGTPGPISAGDVADWIDAGRQNRTERLEELFAAPPHEKDEDRC